LGGDRDPPLPELLGDVSLTPDEPVWSRCGGWEWPRACSRVAAHRFPGGWWRRPSPLAVRCGIGGISAYADGVLERLRERAFGAERPPVWLGLLVAAAAVAFATAAIYPLKAVAPAVSLSVVYLPAVLLVSAYWGLWLGLLTSLASATAFNFFQLPPVGTFDLADGRDWVALAAFTIVAAVVSTMAELARGRALEADRRRGEADLAAALARELLASGRAPAALGATARRVAQALMIPSARIELGVVVAGDRQVAIALPGSEGEQIATLVVPRGLSSETMGRLRAQVAPSLGALVAIALHRDAVQAEAVETAALRRSDELKTALLRAVSHDLRTPLTAMVTAGHALAASTLSDEERTQLSAAVVEEGERLSALIDKLFDLSRLQAGRAEPRREWISLEEVLLAARDALSDDAGEVRFAVDEDVPAVMADAAQLERVFANLLENGLRYSNGLPVSVQVRRLGGRVVVRVVDQGPGIGPGEQERIFEAFYRGPQSGGRTWTGSGLGLAIAKGFVEANGGSISVESLPGQGSSFVVSLPISDDARVAV
jgi:two-component system, OmpR family, sensor histidine kinase KdpD